MIWLRSFSLFSKYLSSLKCWHVDGIINQMVWFHHGHVLLIILFFFFKRLEKHRTSYMLCTVLCKMKRDLCSKSAKTFRMVTASTERTAGPSEARDPVPPQRLHASHPSWRRWGRGKDPTQSLCLRIAWGLSLGRKKYLWFLAFEYQWKDITFLNMRVNWRGC